MMTRDQILCLLERYEQQLHYHFPSATACRRSNGSPLFSRVEHLLWMISEIRLTLDPSKAVRGQIAKAARWLGFVEGSMVVLGFFTQEEVQMLDVESAMSGVE